ncbi:MAG: hypothetical protein ACXWMJ_08935 [Syntrophales bacterium]
MKRNINDYKKEMRELETRSHEIHENAPSEVNRRDSQKREPHVMAPPPIKWARLMPGLMAILMAVLTLIFLILSEVLTKH